MSDKATLTFQGHELDVEVLRLQPDDRVVFSTRLAMSGAVIEQLMKQAKELFPDNEVVFLHDMTVAVVREETS